MSTAPTRAPATAAPRPGPTVPWWALVLPVLCFAALLCLLLAPQRAAAGPATTEGLTHLFRALLRFLVPGS